VPQPDSNIPAPEPSTFVLPRIHQIIRFESLRDHRILTFYVSAHWAAEKFFDGAHRLQFVNEICHRGGYILPPGNPKFTVSRVPEAQQPAHFYGDTMLVTVKWNGCGELAL